MKELETTKTPNKWTGKDIDYYGALKHNSLSKGIQSTDHRDTCYMVNKIEKNRSVCFFPWSQL